MVFQRLHCIYLANLDHSVSTLLSLAVTVIVVSCLLPHGCLTVTPAAPCVLVRRQEVMRERNVLLGAPSRPLLASHCLYLCQLAATESRSRCLGFLL